MQENKLKAFATTNYILHTNYNTNNYSSYYTTTTYKLNILQLILILITTSNTTCNELASYHTSTYKLSILQLLVILILILILIYNIIELATIQLLTNTNTNNINTLIDIIYYLIIIIMLKY